MSRQSIFVVVRRFFDHARGGSVPPVLSFPWFFLSPFIVRPRPSVIAPSHRPVVVTAPVVTENKRAPHITLLRRL